MSNSTITREEIQETIQSLEFTEPLSTDEAIQVLETLGVDWAEAIVDWYNVHNLDVDDLLRMANRVTAYQDTCHQCGATIYDINPVDLDWNNFQGTWENWEQTLIDTEGELNGRPFSFYLCGPCFEKLQRMVEQ